MKQDLSYRDSVHHMGRIWILGALAMLVAVPVAICIYYSAWPPIGGVMKGFLSVAPIFWTVGVIEVFTYVPMLVEAAVGGLVLASVVAAVLVRYPQRIPGTGPLSRALWLSAAALVLLTVFVEVPSKLGSGVPDAGHWLLVATAFNVIRVLALGVAIGLVTRQKQVGASPHPAGTERGGGS